MTCHQLLSKKKMFQQSVSMFFKELVLKTGKADKLLLSWGNVNDTINFTEMKWNFFLLESYKPDLSLSLPFDPFSPPHWWFPLESSPIVCFHCQKWLPLRFLGIIHFNFLQMKVFAKTAVPAPTYFLQSVHSCAEGYTLFNLIDKKILSTIGFV